MREVSILINRNNQKEVQNILFQKDCKWIRTGCFYDCFKFWNEKEIRYS